MPLLVRFNVLGRLCSRLIHDCVAAVAVLA